MSSVGPANPKVPDFQTAATFFARYIANKDRYVPVEGPWESGQSIPLAPRRKKVRQILYWSAYDRCWLAMDDKQIVLRDDIWPTIVSKIRQSGTSGENHTWDAIRKDYDGILKKDVVLACKTWTRFHLWLLDTGNGAQGAVTPGPSPTRRITTLKLHVNTPGPSNTSANIPQPQFRGPQRVAEAIVTPTAPHRDAQMTEEDYSTVSIDDTVRRRRQPRQAAAKSLDRCLASRVSKSVSKGRQHARGSRSRGKT